LPLCGALDIRGGEATDEPLRNSSSVKNPEAIERRLDFAAGWGLRLQGLGVRSAKSWRIDF
jgi:hypothetical protein